MCEVARKESRGSASIRALRNPQLAEAHEWRGHILGDLDRYDEARLSYDEAHRLDPKNEGILLSQTRLLLQMKHIDEALAMCEQAIQLAPTQPSAYQVKGDILIRMKRFEDALSAYQKVVQLDPKDASAHAHVGDILTKLERFAEAVKAYEHALRMSPDSIGVYCSQAEALKKLGRYDQALAACNKGLKLKPKNFSVLFTRAGVLKKLLRFKEANADYLSAQLIAPDPLSAAVCIIAKVDLEQVTEAKTRLQAGGKELSDDAIEAEIHLIYEEKRAAELKASLRASLLFQPVCLLMQEQQKWSGTPKQFKEMLGARFPDIFTKWYKSPQRYIDELRKITSELQVEGIEVGVIPEASLVTLSRVVKENSQPPEEAEPTGLWRTSPSSCEEGK